MHRYLLFVAVISGLLMGQPAAECATPREIRAETEKAAREQAAKNLLRQVLALRMDDRNTVKDFIEATTLPRADLRLLLNGAVQYSPPLFFDDGSCEIRVALKPDSLRANLLAVKKDHYKATEGEFAGVTFDFVGNKVIEAVGTGPLPENHRQSLGPAEGLPGWESVSARKRMIAERAAFREAIEKVRAQVAETPFSEQIRMSALIAQKPLLGEALTGFFKELLPASKAYLPKGIVEVKVSVELATVWAALQAANHKIQDNAQRTDEALLKAAIERDQGKLIEAVAHARVDGRPVEFPDLKAAEIPLDLSDLAGLGLEEGK